MLVAWKRREGKRRNHSINIYRRPLGSYRYAHSRHEASKAGSGKHPNTGVSQRMLYVHSTAPRTRVRSVGSAPSSIVISGESFHGACLCSHPREIRGKDLSNTNYGVAGRITPSSPKDVHVLKHWWLVLYKAKGILEMELKLLIS